MINKDWTPDEAIAADDDAQKSDPNYEFRRGPLCQWQALHDLDGLGKSFESGDRAALFAAIRICASRDLPLPPWAVVAFIAGYDAVLNCRADSWDDVFGRPWPKGFHLGRARHRRHKRFQIFHRIRDIRESNPDQVLDDRLFEEIGKEFAVAKTLCKKLYYQAGGGEAEGRTRARARASGIKRSYRRRS